MIEFDSATSECSDTLESGYPPAPSVEGDDDSFCSGSGSGPESPRRNVPTLMKNFCGPNRRWRTSMRNPGSKQSNALVGPQEDTGAQANQRLHEQAGVEPRPLVRAIQGVTIAMNLGFVASKWLCAVLLRKLFIWAETKFGPSDGTSILGVADSSFWKVVFLDALSFDAALALTLVLAVPTAICSALLQALPVRLASVMARARRALLLEISLDAVTTLDGDHSTAFLLEQISALFEFEAHTKYLRAGEKMHIGLVVASCLVVFWQATIVAIVFLGAIVFAEFQLSSRLLQPHMQRRADLMSRLSAFILDIMRAADLVVLHGMDTKERRALSDRETPVRNVDFRLSGVIFVIGFISLCMIMILMPALLLVTNGLFARAGSVSEAVNTLFALTAMVFLLDEGHKSLMRLNLTNAQEASYVRALTEVNDALVAGQMALASRAGRATDLVLTIGPGDLIFREVSVLYPSASTPAVSGVTFSISRGATVALVAESGGGKSTLFRAASGLVPLHRGVIAFGQVVLSRTSQRAIRSRMGFVSQTSQLFARSVRDNVWYGNANVADDAKIWAVLSQVGLDGWASGLDRGLDTVLASERVVSGGQAQRLQIARLLCRENLHFALLDECMSALDPGMRAIVTRALKPFLEDKTALVITHSEDTVADICDQVVDLGKLQRGEVGAIMPAREYLDALAQIEE